MEEVGHAEVDNIDALVLQELVEGAVDLGQAVLFNERAGLLLVDIKDATHFEVFAVDLAIAFQMETGRESAVTGDR